MDSTTLLELIVFAVSFVTLGFSVWSLFVTRTDHLLIQRLEMNGLKHLTVNARLVRDTARVIMSLTLVVTALICLHLPPDHDLTSMVLKVALIFLAVFLSVAVMMDWRWRVLIDDAIADIEQRKS